MVAHVRRFELSQTQIPASADPSARPEFGVYEAAPDRQPKAGVIVVQEIFGVDAGIRGVCEQYARAGYLAWAPGFFDHYAPGFDQAHGPEGMAAGRELAGKTGMDLALADVALCAREQARLGIRSLIVGYCWGGSLAWLASSRLGGPAPGQISASSSYYGSLAPKHKDEPARCPTILHFGEKDPHIGREGPRAFQEARPETSVFFYPAGHGFNSVDGPAYDEACARLAFDRTLELFAAALK